MTVRVVLPPLFSKMIGDEDRVEVRGKSVGECLVDLGRHYPVLKTELFESGGGLKAWVEIYVNNHSTYPQEVAYPVQDDDEIWVVLLMAGG